MINQQLYDNDDLSLTVLIASSPSTVALLVSKQPIVTVLKHYPTAELVAEFESKANLETWCDYKPGLIAIVCALMQKPYLETREFFKGLVCVGDVYFAGIAKYHVEKQEKTTSIYNPL